MVNSITFPFYPSSNRTYGVFADVDGSRANTALFQQRSLLLADSFETGQAATNAPYLVEGLQHAGRLWGVGSVLYQMVEQYLRGDTFGELWGIGLGSAGANRASGTATVSAPAGGLGTGQAPLSVGGRVYPVSVLAGDAPAAVAARLAALVNADANRVADATAAGAAVTLTARAGGLLGNDIDLRLLDPTSVGGASATLPAAVALVPFAGGAGVPSLDTALANCGDMTFDFIGVPYTEAAALGALDAFLGFGVGRWSWQSMLYGGYFSAARGTPGQLAALGQTRNSPFGSILGVFDTPDPVWVVAADYAARCAASLRANPNTPLQNILMGFKAPPVKSGFVRSLRNTLLYDGISTYTVNRAGQVVLERAITTYQTNTAGIPDNAYLDVETMYGTTRLIRDWQAEMIRLYPRSKLLEDGNAIPAGSNATTAQQIRLATIAWYRQECEAGNAQDPDQFARAVIAQNAGNGLVKELLPFFLPQQLRQVAGLVRFEKP